MAYKELKIVSKPGKTPLEIVAVTSRISAPLMIQPEYQFDVSDMYGIFVPEVSFGYGLYWNNGYFDVSIETGIGAATKVYVDGSLVTRDIHIQNMDISIGNIYNLVFTTNTSLYQLTNFVGQINSSTKYYATNASVNLAFLTNSSLGNVSQLIYSLNTSIGYYVTNASVNLALQKYLKEASVGYGLEFHAGKMDVSIKVLDLYDTDVSMLGDGQLLHFDADTSLWKNVDVINIDDFFTTREYIDGSLNTLRLLGCDSSTSNLIKFDRPQGHIYGTISSPLSGPIYMSASDAILGTVSLAIHSDVSLAIPSSFKKLTGYYDACINNFIYVQYIDTNNQLYVIHQIQ